jgi:8-oxo-dGTP diphosphatase
MTEYVMGLMFSVDKQNVLMVEKNRPDWQKGKLNGIGGKIEEGEKPVDAMVREFREETGINTHWTDWEIFSIVGNNTKKVTYFKAFSDQLYEYQQAEQEVPVVVPARQVWIYNCVADIPFLVPMALDGKDLYIIKTLL